MYDPFDELYENDPFGPVRRPRISQPLPTPEEEQSLLAQIGGGIASGVGAVGNLFDVPGSMVRDIASGVATGDWGTYNPFDQILSPFSGENRSTGREVLSNWGLASENDPDAWEAADFAGFGVDLLTDPLLFATLPFGAASKAGKLAQRTGLAAKAANPAVGKRVAMMTDTIGQMLKRAPELKPAVETAASKMGLNLADELDRPLGGLMRIGIPGTGIEKTFGTGKTAQKFAGALDTGGKWLKGTAPVRAARHLFDPRVRDTYEALDQRLAELSHEKISHADVEARRIVRETEKSIYEAMDAANDELGGIVNSGYGNDLGGFTTGDVIKSRKQGNYGSVVGKGASGFQVSFRNQKTGREVIRELDPADMLLKHKHGTGEAKLYALDKLSRATDAIIGYTQEIKGDVQGAFDELLPGVKPSKNLSDKIARAGEAMAEANKAGVDLARTVGVPIALLDENINHMPRYINEWVAAQMQGQRLVDPRFRSALMRSEEIRAMPKPIVNKLLTDAAARKDINALRKGYAQYAPKGMDVDEYVTKLDDWLKKHPSAPMFTDTYARDFLDYQKNLHHAIESTDAVHGFFAENFAPLGNGIVPLEDAYKAAGMPDAAILRQAQLTGRADLMQLGVPQAVVNTAVKHFNMYKPEYKGMVASFVDWANGAFKGGVTTPFPAFHLRNEVWGHVNNILNAVESPADLPKYIQSVIRTVKLGKTPLDKLDDAERGALELMHDWHISGRKEGAEGIELGHVKESSTRLQPPELKELVNLPQSYREGYKSLADIAEAKGKTGSPLLGKTRAFLGAPVQAGGKVSEWAEYLNRGTLFNYLLEKGWSPDQAARRVSELHFDYKDITKFERDVMRRVIPFYSFSKKMSVLAFKELVEKPGGGMAQAIKASARGTNSNQDFVPEWVSQTTAIPLGKNEAGNANYFTGFGMGWEDPLSFFGGGFKDAGLELLSRTTPLIKGPLEAFTGQSFFQRGPTGGRNLEDLDPTLGRTIGNLIGSDEPVNVLPRVGEHLLANSPISRLATTGRQLSELALLGTDRQRKGPGAIASNLLSGLRVTTVSPQARDKAIRDLVSKEMSSYPESRRFVQSYVPKDLREGMTAEERAKVEKLDTLNRLLGKRGRGRKKERLKAGSI